MATLTLDTYRAVERLRTSGMPQGQAEAVVETLREVSLEGMVTKQDLKVGLAELRADIFKWAVPLLIGQTAVFAAVVSWLR